MKGYCMAHYNGLMGWGRRRVMHFVQDDNEVVEWGDKRNAYWHANLPRNFKTTWRGIWRVKELKQ